MGENAACSSDTSMKLGCIGVEQACAVCVPLHPLADVKAKAELLILWSLLLPVGSGWT